MTALLDAGYYRIKSEPLTADNFDITYHKDTAYLVRLKQGKTLPKPERFAGDYVEFSDRDDKSQRYVLIRSREGDAFTIPAETAETAERLEFTPTPTEKRTLEYGLHHYGREVDKIALLVEDYGFPGAFSDHLGTLVPEDYQSIMAKAGKSNPLMVSERKSRNTGAKTVEKRIGRIGKNDPESGEQITAEHEHARTGFIVGHRQLSAASARSCANGNLVICSTSIMDESPSGKDGAAVALVRDVEGHAVPSCGVVGAGQMQLFERDHADRVIAVYHTKDDPNIRFKNGDAAFIYAWARPESNMGYTHVTLSGDAGSEHVVTDTYNTAELRGHNGTAYSELLDDLRSKHCAVTPLVSGKGIHISDVSNDHGAACRIA